MASVKLPRLLKAIRKSVVKPFKKLFRKEKNISIKPINEEDDNETETCCFPKCKIFKKFKKQKEKVIFSQEESVETQPHLEEKNLKIKKQVSFTSKTNDWLPDLNLTKKHKEELQSDAWLDDRIIDAAQELLKRQFNTEGLQTCLLSELQFGAVHGPSVQIHYDNTRNHWLTSCFRSDHVEIADSMKARKLPQQVEKQINDCYGEVIREPTKSMKQLNVDQQPNGNDCGVYAIANAFEFLSNGDPTCWYNGKRMRKHLITCLERGEITAFPTRFSITQRKILPCTSSGFTKKREIEDEEKKDEKRMKEDEKKMKEDEKKIKGVEKRMKEDEKNKEDEKRAKEDEKKAKEDEKRIKEDEKRIKEDEKRIKEDDKKAKEDEKRMKEDEKRIKEDDKKANEDEKRMKEDEKRIKEDDNKAKEDEKRMKEDEKRIKEDDNKAKEDEKRKKEDEKRMKEDEKRMKEDEKRTDNSLEKNELSPLRIHCNKVLQDWLRYGLQTYNRLTAQQYYGFNWLNSFKRLKNIKKKDAKSLKQQDPSHALVSSANNRSKAMFSLCNSAPILALYFFWKKK